MGGVFLPVTPHRRRMFLKQFQMKFCSQSCKIPCIDKTRVNVNIFK